MKWSNSSSGKSSRQVKFEDLYVQHNIDLQSIIRRAFAMTLQDGTPPHFRGRGYMADHMSWNIIGLLKENFGLLMFEDEEKRPYMKLDKHTRVYFKKLNEKYHPQNVITEHVKQLNSMSLVLDDEPITVLYAGFRIRNDEFWDELKGCYLLEMASIKKPHWVSDMSPLTARMTVRREPVLMPIVSVDLSDEITVTGKNDKQNDANQERKSS